MGAAYGSDILYSESVEPENRVYNMEKIWEVILILVLAGMGFKVYRMSIAWSRIFPRGDELEPSSLGSNGIYFAT